MRSLYEKCNVFFEKLLFSEKNKDSFDGNFEEYKKEKDIDKLCFQVSLNRFLRTGTKENAFDVFFCYVELFKLFGDGFTQSANTLLNLLYDHEIGAATTLEKHRDHYSHSVYNFAMGLAFYNDFPAIQEAFAKKYLPIEKDQNRIKYLFLKSWGLAALFHDVGYPLEISFTNLLQYQATIFLENEKDEEGKPIKINNDFLNVAYMNIDKMITLSPEEQQRLGIYKNMGIKTIHDLLSVALSKMWRDQDDNPIIISAQYITDYVVKGKTYTDQHGVQHCKPKKYMDHAYFSSVIVLKKLLQKDSFELDELTMDAMLAILLHAGFFRFNLRGDLIPKDTKLTLSQNPLAYLLSFCDEIQCWDRTPYGKTSKETTAPWDMDLSTNHNNSLFITYHLQNDLTIPEKESFSCEEVKNKTLKYIQIDDLLEEKNFKIFSDSKKIDKIIRPNFSETRYMDLLQFAKVINYNYCPCDGVNKIYEIDKVTDLSTIQDALDKCFAGIPLEHKISNIQQAKHYAEHLDKIGCFFSSKFYNYKKKTSFTLNEKNILALSEHIRWAHAQAEMGWKYGIKVSSEAEETDPYTYTSSDRNIRRLHSDMVPFDDLDPKERLKDIQPMENIIKNLSLLSNLSVYQLPHQLSPQIIGCIGHRNLMRINTWKDAEPAIRSSIRKKFRELSENNNLTIYSGFACGADLVFVEEAINCGLPVVAVLSTDWEKIWQDHDEKDKFSQLFSQVSKYTISPMYVQSFQDVRKYIVETCDILFALWDQDTPPEPYSVESPEDEKNKKYLLSYNTFDSINKAQKTNKPIVYFPSIT